MPVRVTLAAVSICCLLMSSCSKTEGTNAEPSVGSNFYASSIAVCELVRRPELEAILGFEFSEGAGEFNPDFLALSGVSTCRWTRTDCESMSSLACESLGSRAKYYLGVVYSYGPEIFKKLERTLRNPRNPVAETVKGLGDDAIWWGQANQLFVFSDKKIVAIHIKAPEGVFALAQDNRARARRLAEVALSRLR